MNTDGGNKSTGGVGPARQRLDADDMLCLDVDDRLEVDVDAPVLYRPTQIGFQLDSVEEALVHPGLEHNGAALAHVLGPVHGDIGIAQGVI